MSVRGSLRDLTEIIFLPEEIREMRAGGGGDGEIDEEKGVRLEVFEDGSLRNVEEGKSQVHYVMGILDIV